MLSILLIIAIMLTYLVINSIVELIPFMVCLVLYLGVIVFGIVMCIFDYSKNNINRKEYGGIISYLFISIFFPNFIFKTLGIIRNDVYSARFIGLVSTILVVFILFMIRKSAQKYTNRKILTGIFMIVICGFFLVFLNLGYKSYSQQAAERAGEVEEYMVEKSTPLLVKISVAGNQKSTLFGQFFVTKDKLKYYYMGIPITHQFAFKRMPPNSKLCVTGRTLYEKDEYIEVYCKENGFAGYIKKEKLTCIVDYKYITNKCAPIYNTYEKTVDAISAENGETVKSKMILVNDSNVIERIPEGTEIWLADGPDVPFGYECIETPGGRIGYMKKDDFDIIPISRK